MILKDIYIDKDKKLRLKGESIFNIFHVNKPEIILTKEEALEMDMDLKDNPKGFYIKIDGIRVPINIK